MEDLKKKRVIQKYIFITPTRYRYIESITSYTARKWYRGQAGQKTPKT